MDFKLKWQDTLLYIVLLLIGGVIIALPTFPSMDGAAHLYNAHIVKDLLALGESSPYASHFTFNAIPVPNWLDHLGLGILLVLFKPLFAQKVFLVASVFAFVLIYNRIGKKNNNTIVSFAILPMVFSFFFFTGLYNQHWSYIVLIAYLLFLSKSEFQIQESRKFYLTVFVFSILFWITSILGFAVFMLVTGCLSVISEKNNRLKLNLNWKQIGTLTLLVLPTLVSTFMFILSTPMSNAEPYLTLWNRFEGLFHLDLIKLYNMGGESYFLGAIGFVFTILLVVLGRQLVALKKYALLIVLIMLFLAAVFIPNQAGAGMLSTRLAMYFWVLVLVLVKHYFKPHKLLYVTSGIVFVCFFFINNKKYNTHIKRLGHLGLEVYELGRNIKTSETVLGLNETGDWYIGHLLDYACLPNKSINISNYEANYPWFPIQWNSTNPQSKRIDELWKKGKKSEIMELELDWVLVYGELSSESQNRINKNFILHSSIDHVRLFKHNTN